MTNYEIKEALDKSLQRFVDELESWMTSSPTSFNESQKEEIKFLMKQVFYTLDDFKDVLEKLAK